MRNVLAVVLGMVVGMAANMAIIELNNRYLFPAPEGLDMADFEQVRAHVATLPVAAVLVVMAAHLSQALFGGAVAARLARSSPITMAMWVGVLSMIGGIAAFAMIGGPTWMLVELPLYLVVAFVAGFFAAR